MLSGHAVPRPPATLPHTRNSDTLSVGKGVPSFGGPGDRCARGTGADAPSSAGLQTLVRPRRYLVPEEDGDRRGPGRTASVCGAKPADDRVSPSLRVAVLRGPRCRFVRLGASAADRGTGQ